MGLIDQVYALAYEAKREKALKSPNTKPSAPPADASPHTPLTGPARSLSDVLGEPKERRTSVTDMVAEEFRAPFHFDVESEGTADDALAEAKRVARGKAAEAARLRKKHSGGYLHANPTGVSSGPTEQDTSAFATSTAASTDAADYRPHAELRAKAVAGGANMLLRRTSNDAVEMKLKIEEANLVAAERDREILAQVVAGRRGSAH